MERDSHSGKTSKPDRTLLNKGVDGVARPSSITSSLVEQFNNITGRTSIALVRSDYDYMEEIARSSYADMLHDTERNQKYYAAIKRAIQALRAKGQQVKVLDIGTGTGLLSMMAATEGADCITACEAFEPMATCAEDVIRSNSYGDTINVIHARSTDVGVGEEKEMEQRANLLVTEVFDTELIGEEAIATYSHAHEHLLEEDFLAVPRAANMYAQLVCSDHIRRWNNLMPMEVKPGDQIKFPAAFDQCGGCNVLHDLQLDQVDQSLFTPVAPPFRVFRFDFSKRGSLKKQGISYNEVQSQMENGTVDAVLMWWDLEMDPEGEIVLSCAPRWAHPLGDKLPWRDHWMQAIYYPPKRVSVNYGDALSLSSYHDEYSLWFDVAAPPRQPQPDSQPWCQCGLHVTIGRSRLGMLNDETRNNIFLQVLKKNITSSTVCLCVSDGSLLPIMAAKLGAKKVFVSDRSPSSTKFLEIIIEKNQLEEKIVILEKCATDIEQATVAEQDIFQGFEVDLVIGEPFFQEVSLPWDTLHFWYALNHLRSSQAGLSPTVKVFPATITIYAMAMHFKDLWKIRAPVGHCEGFKLHLFDKLIQDASESVDCNVEPQPLWEYPGRAVSQPLKVLSINMNENSTKMENIALDLELKSEVEDRMRGVALWCEFDFGEGQTISTGPRKAPVMGQLVEWNVYWRQAVHLMGEPKDVLPGQMLKFRFEFVPQTASIKFDWRF